MPNETAIVETPSNVAEEETAVGAFDPDLVPLPPNEVFEVQLVPLEHSDIAEVGSTLEQSNNQLISEIDNLINTIDKKLAKNARKSKIILVGYQEGFIILRERFNNDKNKDEQLCRRINEQLATLKTNIENSFGFIFQQ